MAMPRRLVIVVCVDEQSQRILNLGSKEVTPTKRHNVRGRSNSPTCVSWASPSNLFCRVSIEFSCSVHRLEEDLFLLYDVPSSNSAAYGAFPSFLDIIDKNFPYRVEY
jgi:hypothetical protein